MLFLCTCGAKTQELVRSQAYGQKHEPQIDQPPRQAPLGRLLGEETNGHEPGRVRKRQGGDLERLTQLVALWCERPGQPQNDRHEIQGNKRPIPGVKRDVVSPHGDNPDERERPIA